ncbi:MAG: Uma2 family endonuclease, partial [Calditrichaeota bacterium]
MAFPSKSSSSQALKFTYGDYRNLPDNGARYEILAGELLMSPSPNRIHQYVLLKLAKYLDEFAERHHAGQIFIAPFDVVLS